MLNHAASSPQRDERHAAIRAAVASELRAEIGRQNLDQGQVAERVGMSRITVNRLLNEHRSIDSVQLFDFADGLGIDIGNLMSRARQKYTEQLRAMDEDRTVHTGGPSVLDGIIGEQLRRERVERKMSRAALGAAAGISDKTIQRIEDGTRSGDIRQIAAILAVLGIALDTFVAEALKATPNGTHMDPTM
jgi:transcriptional regulator with XRE-family HTH domain